MEVVTEVKLSMCSHRSTASRSLAVKKRTSLAVKKILCRSCEEDPCKSWHLLLLLSHHKTSDMANGRAGHLNINGCKMSKSLKNFISIRCAP